MVRAAAALLTTEDDLLAYTQRDRYHKIQLVAAIRREPQFALACNPKRKGADRFMNTDAWDEEEENEREALHAAALADLGDEIRAGRENHEYVLLRRHIVEGIGDLTVPGGVHVTLQDQLNTAAKWYELVGVATEDGDAVAFMRLKPRYRAG